MDILVTEPKGEKFIKKQAKKTVMGSFFKPHPIDLIPTQALDLVQVVSVWRDVLVCKSKHINMLCERLLYSTLFICYLCAITMTITIHYYSSVTILWQHLYYIALLFNILYSITVTCYSITVTYIIYSITLLVSCLSKAALSSPSLRFFFLLPANM